MIPLLTDHQESPGMTFAEPGVTRGATETSHDWFGGVTGGAPAQIGVQLGLRAVTDIATHPQAYAALFNASERTQRLTGNIASESAAREEAYDARIAAVRKATGLELENPERGGYQIDARRAIRDEVRAGLPNGPIEGGIYARARQMFDAKLAEAQQAHPDLQFGSIDDDAKTIARGAATTPPPQASDQIAGLVTGFAGGMWGSRRDPVFLGSLVAGPASAAGRTALSRIAQSALYSGLYNAGVSAVEQPAVQDWRARIGIEHGVAPAMQDIGLAFLMGAIPGAVIHGFSEGMRAPLQRTLAGHPVPGDVDALKGALEVASPRDAAGLRAGEDSVAADQATITIPKPKDVPADLHDDMMAAALRRADQPDAPSPEAVKAVHAIDAYHGSPHDFDAFSVNKIGEGEGAQSYGHGLYFAENPKVAESYAGPEPGSAAAGIGLKRGPLYQVRIHADRERMLDWDAPVVGQSAQVQAVAQQHGLPGTATGRDLYHALVEKRAGPMEQGGVLNLGTFEEGAPGASEALRVAGVPGIRYLDQGSRGAGIEAPERIAGRLEEIGARQDQIKSLSSEQQTEIVHSEFVALDAEKANLQAELKQYRQERQTRNFVVFSDKDVEITHKNGKPVRPSPDAEIADRLKAAEPKTPAEAAAVADEALDDMGRARGMAALRDRMAAADAERAPLETLDARLARLDEENTGGLSPELKAAHQVATSSVTPVETARLLEPLKIALANGREDIARVIVERAEQHAERRKAAVPGMDREANPERYRQAEQRLAELADQAEETAKALRAAMPKLRPRGDVMDKVPWVDDKGRPDVLTPGGLAKVGERETNLSMLVRSCK